MWYLALVLNMGGGYIQTVPYLEYNQGLGYANYQLCTIDRDEEQKKFKVPLTCVWYDAYEVKDYGR